MPADNETDPKITQAELLQVILSLSALVTGISQVMIDRTATSGEIVDDAVMDRFSRAVEEHKKALQVVLDKKLRI